MVIHYGYAFPCAFALMTSRKTGAYDAVFEKIKNIVPAFSPKLIMSDFEMPLVKYLEKQFPTARKSGCFFHYCQAILRKARVLGLTPLLRTNKDAKKALQMMRNLALLPADKIEVGVAHIRTYLLQKHLEGDFTTLLRYHRKQWLERVGADAVSVFNRARRTNNDSESFHATLQKLLRVRGPNVWEFIDCIRNITAATAREIQAFVDGGLQIRSLGKRRYRLNDQRIQSAYTDFANHGDVGRFLNRVTYSAESLFQSSMAEEVAEEEHDEEFVLAPLAEDVPPEFHIRADNIEIDAPEVNDEEVNAEAADGTHSQDETTGNSNGNELNMTVCMICQTSPPTTLLLPCRHFGLCDDCCTTRQTLQNTPPSPEAVVWNRVIDHSIRPIDRIRVEQYVRVIPVV